jgi:hypothetical protein
MPISSFLGWLTPFDAARWLGDRIFAFLRASEVDVERNRLGEESDLEPLVDVGRSGIA